MSKDRDSKKLDHENNYCKLSTCYYATAQIKHRVLLDECFFVYFKKIVKVGISRDCLNKIVFQELIIKITTEIEMDCII